MDYSGVCLCSPSNFEAMEEQDLSYEDADYLSFPGDCKDLPIFINTKKSGWKLYYRVIVYIGGYI